MKNVLPILLLVLTVGLTGFSNGKKFKKFENYGFYLGGNPDNSPLSLKINEDGTYNFCDYSNMKKQVKVTGNWIQERDRIVLQGNENVKFHNSWKMDPDCACLKAKKGLTFYRLCQE